MTRKLVVSQFVSMDGVMEDPAGTEGSGLGAWSFQFERGPDGDAFKLDEALASDALLLGRKTYEIFAGSWPSRTGEFADKFNSMAKFVVSSTLQRAEWNNSTLIQDGVDRAVARLKQEPGGDILVNGSAQLVRTLMHHDLVDEYRLMVFPVVLGSGTRLFGDGVPAATVQLLTARQVGGEGVLVLTYARVAGG